ncbi:GNAT family N-acetyltransferase [Paractinoplanes lichenicola]|uniref:GNAT family N-acetyltransferase n=1 Tax=Paractinoplanes lichenicola TaxID=2802976 RepID=A0ABS1VY82_9ACTN|nr:GNAT family N-acetyltransferase [Actinoplanes lichenicola]MBL7259459.1 GNAT family N-acetyltransferase [Actinoplanes lichenicola]
MSVRPYESSDREAVLALAPRLAIGVADWRNPELVHRAVEGWLSTAADQAHLDNHAVFVAVAADTVIGAVSVTERTHFTGEQDAYVGELAVAATHESQGIGAALMRAAEQWSRQRGLTRLTLETGAANTRARRFYDRLGYHEEDVRLTKAL